MKFNQVNEIQIEQANEAVAAILKLRKILAKEKLAKNFLKCLCDDAKYSIQL